MSGVADLPPNVHPAKHPLIAHKITRLRNRETKPAEFRNLLKEISFYLGYEVRLTALENFICCVHVSLFGGGIDFLNIKCLEIINIVYIFLPGHHQYQLQRAGCHHSYEREIQWYRSF